MAGMSIAASAPGWESSIRSMKAMPTTLKREASRKGRTIAEPLAREIRAEGKFQGSHAGSVADTVRSGMRAGVPTVNAGGRLPYVLGSEYGGQHRRTTYTGTSPLGRRYLIVQRRTTMQFRPHRGHAGYWFLPTISADGRGREAVLKAWAEVVEQVVREF